MPVASTYSAAIDLVIRHGADNSKLFEVNADGSIRTQNWREKLGNFGARITRRYDLRKDTKDAAVAAALERMAQDALNGIDQNAKSIVAYQQQYPADVLVRFHQARDRVAQRNTPRNVDVVPPAQNQVDPASVTSLHQQGAVNVSNQVATDQAPTVNNPVTQDSVDQSTGATATTATTAKPATIDLQALANQFQVNPRIARYLVGAGPGFGEVIRGYLSANKGSPISWEAPVAKRYAALLNKTYEQEANFVAIGRRPAIEDREILSWAIASLKQAQ